MAVKHFTKSGWWRSTWLVLGLLFVFAVVGYVSHRIDVVAIIRAVGLIGITAIIFAESGLLIGFFLPGDSLLFTAGVLASQGYLEIVPLVLFCFLAAVLGDSFGYWFGRKVGQAIFRRQNSLIFHKEHLEKAQAFYEKHGGKTIVLARFTPVIRTFAPIVAGVSSMKYSVFLAYNIVGGFIWAVCIPLLGFYLGNAVPDIERFVIPGVVLVVVLSVLPPILHIWRNPAERSRLVGWLRGQ